mgnify:CR=1 FL=1
MKRAKTYQLASAPKAKTQVLECHDLYERLRRTYRNASHRKSIYQLVTNPIWNVQFPKSKIRLVGRSILDHGKLEEIFKTHADLFKQLGEKDKLLLKSLYKKSYKELDVKEARNVQERSGKRLMVDLQSSILIEDNHVEVRCLNFSLNGVGLFIGDTEQFMSLALGQNIVIWIYSAHNSYCEISGEIVNKVNKRIGVKVLGGELEKWENIIQNYEKEFISIHIKELAS